MNSSERPRAALSDRYRIEREIGSGGMAIVYRARDLKHDRDVAVKVLNPELAQTLGAERFLREIKTAASLSHPHILPLFDSGAADGFLYFVMPYVKGETLRTRLEKEGQLPVEDAVRITREVADALAYAHRQGVVHRDVKPANIMLQEGHAVLADFGVAHAVAEARDERLTRTGTSLGTPAYMSPEQAAGEQELDGRSDQYALGCVLYEMLAGQPPFSGAQVEAVLRQHLTMGPPPVRQARPLVPPEVAEVVERALAKSPADRFRTTGEMAAALVGPMGRSASAPRGAAEEGSPFQAERPPGVEGQTHRAAPTKTGRWTPGRLAATGVVVILVLASALRLLNGEPEAPAVIPYKVAVLPFEDRSRDPELGDFGRVAADWIADALTAIDTVQISPSSTVREVLGNAEAQSDPLPQITETTQAGLVVTGWFGIVDDSIEMRARLVDGAERRVMASFGPVRSPRSDPIAALSSLGQEVAGSVAARFDDILSGDPGPPPTYEAYTAYRNAADLAASGRWPEALREYERAAKIDSTFFRPWIGIGMALTVLGDLPRLDSVLQGVESHRSQLLPLDRLWVDHGRAFLQGDLPEMYRTARELFRRAPNPTSRMEAANLALAVNRPREAADVMASASETSFHRRDTGVYHQTLTLALHILGEHQQELSVAREARERFPGRPGMVVLEARALAGLHRTTEAEERAKELLMLPPDDKSMATDLMEIGDALAAHDQGSAANRVFAQALGVWQEEGGQENTAMTIVGVELLRRLDRLQEAAELAEEAHATSPEDRKIQALVGLVAGQRGDRELAERMAGELARRDDPYDFGENTYHRAGIRARLGDVDRGVDLLRRAHAEGRWLGYEPRVDPDLSPLHGQPAYEELMRPKG